MFDDFGEVMVSKGTSTYYHISPSSNLGRIQTEGLKPRRVGGLHLKSQKRARIYLVADLRSLGSLLESLYGRQPGTWSVFEVVVPSGYKVYEAEEDLGMAFESYFITRSIPLEYLKHLGTFSITWPKIGYSAGERSIPLEAVREGREAQRAEILELPGSEEEAIDVPLITESLANNNN